MFKLSSSAHVLPLIGVALASGSAMLPITANAAGGAYYRAELANPAATGKFVARGVVWSCTGTSCVAGRGTSRPLLMCAGLAKEAGQVKSFAADGKALEAEDLSRCNGAA
jgi:hypothetical protein